MLRENDKNSSTQRRPFFSDLLLLAQQMQVFIHCRISSSNIMKAMLPILADTVTGYLRGTKMSNISLFLLSYGGYNLVITP